MNGSPASTKAVVTGGAGFIGSHLVEDLLADGHEVHVVDDLATGHAANLPDGAVFHEGSVLDRDLLRRVFEGAEVIYHQAALGSVPRSVKDPMRSHEVNLTGTLEVLEAARARDARHVVFAASSSAYGDTETLPKQEDLVPRPKSPYAVTKLGGEAYCRAYADTYGLATVALRYFNVYGPRQDPEGPYAAVIPRFIEAALTGGVLQIHGDGSFSRDFTFVRDAVQANRKAATAAAPAWGEVMNIGAGGRTTIQALAETIVSLAGDTGARIEHGPTRPGDVAHSKASIEKAQRLIGYEPRVELREGLEHTLEWFQVRHEAVRAGG